MRAEQVQKGQNTKALPPESSGEQGQKVQNVCLCLRQRGGVDGVSGREVGRQRNQRASVYAQAFPSFRIVGFLFHAGGNGLVSGLVSIRFLVPTQGQETGNRLS